MDGSRRPRWLRWVGWAAGLALVVAAGVVGFRGVDLAVLRGADPLVLGAIGGAVALNLLLTALLFWVITLSFDADPPVSMGRMLGLITASALLNYLPRAGLIGRAAFLKVRHRLPLMQSLVIVLVVLLLTGVVFGGALAAHMFGFVLDRVGLAGAVALGLIVLMAASDPLTRRLLGRPMVAPWAWVLIKTADLLVGGLRLWLAFRVIGEPIVYVDAVLLMAAGFVIHQVGPTPNGLGVREWGIAGLAHLMTPGMLAAATLAAVVDRAIELLVVLPAGLAGLWNLRDHLTR